MQEGPKEGIMVVKSSLNKALLFWGETWHWGGAFRGCVLAAKDFSQINELLLMVQKSCTHQLRLVGYPLICRVLYIPGGCLGFLNHQGPTYIVVKSRWRATPKRLRIVRGHEAMIKGGDGDFW